MMAWDCKDKSWLPIPTTYDYVGLYEFVVNGPSKYDNDYACTARLFMNHPPLAGL